MAHKHDIPSVDETFEFTSGTRNKLIISALVGIVLVIAGYFLVSATGHHDSGHEAAHGDHHGATVFSRLVANLWMNSVYFLGISLVGVFFLSYSTVAKAGWYTSFKRIPEAFPAFMIVPAIIMVVLFLIPGTRETIFHWTHHGIMDPASENYDKIIAGKSWYLNFGFFLARMLVYFGVWYYLWLQIRKYSLLEDEHSGLDNYYKGRGYSKMFLIFFAVTSSTAAWDFSMSIDTHWFSTMFGWYHLASWHVAGLASMMLAILLLKDRGYLQGVNFSAIHDLGKLIFGFSVFWAYTWFSQYLLIFYANLPEETIYFEERLSGYGGRYFAPFILNLILNFVFPFLILMARESKRNITFLKLACISIIFGHWIDFYQIQMPGIAKDQGGFGFMEIGTTLFFVSMFIYFLLNQLSKSKLVAQNHPFLEESLHHDI